MATTSKAKKKTVRIASGLKRVRQDVKLNAANTALRSQVPHRHQERAEGRDARRQGQGAELFKSAQSVIDSVADKGLFHKNKAARHKSRLCGQGQGAGRRRLRLAGAIDKGPPRAGLFHCWRRCFRVDLDGSHLQVVVAREVDDEVPGHRLDVAQGLVDDHALDAVDDARHAVRRVADERADAAGRPLGPKARHRAGQPLGPVARAKASCRPGDALNEEFAVRGMRRPECWV